MNTELRSASQMLRAIPDDVAERLQALRLPHVDHGILPSELVAVCGLAEAFGVSRIIESGRWLGYSTLTLSRYFADTVVRIDSIEYSRGEAALQCERRLAGCENLRLYYGDAFKLLPGMLAQDARRTLVLLDGPKGAPAVELATRIMRQFPWVVAVLLHDCYVGSAARAAVVQSASDCAFTDQLEFLNRFHHLDDGIPLGTKQPKYSGDPSMADGKSYGPTLSIMLPTKGRAEAGVPRSSYFRERMLLWWGLGEGKARNTMYALLRKLPVGIEVYRMSHKPRTGGRREV